MNEEDIVKTLLKARRAANSAGDNLFYAAEATIERNAPAHRLDRAKDEELLTEAYNFIIVEHSVLRYLSMSKMPTLDIGNSGPGRSFYDARFNRIVLAHNMGTRWTLLHEVAHAVHHKRHRRGNKHNAAFCYILAALVTRYIDASCGNKLLELASTLEGRK